MIRFKEGVDLSSPPGIRWEEMGYVLESLDIYSSIYTNDGVIVITSALDGEHMKGSLHYKGLAFDVRRWNILNITKFCEDLRTYIGPEYQVVIEKNHIHIEYDPPHRWSGKEKGE